MKIEYPKHACSPWNMCFLMLFGNFQLKWELVKYEVCKTLLHTLKHVQTGNKTAKIFGVWTEKAGEWFRW